MSESFYVRIRGRVSGPFHLDQLRQMAKQGRFSRAHEVSDDGQNWSTAGDVKSLFPTRHVTPPADEPKEPILKTPEPEQNHHQNPDWYFADGDEKRGPLSLADLQELVRRGVVTPSSSVWSEQLTEWTPIAQIPQLALLANQSVSKPSSAQNLDKLKMSVARSLGWMLFLAVFGFILGVSLTIAGVGATAVGFNRQQATIISTGLFSTVYGVLFIVGTVLFNGFRMRMGAFAKSGQPLERAFTSLYGFVLYVGVLLIVYLAFGLVLGIWAASVGGAFWQI